MLKKCFVLLIAAAMMLLGCALADGAKTDAPQEILDHIARNYAYYALEDYAEMPDTPQGNLGLALIRDRRERRLVIYRDKSGAMSKWIETAKGIPQHENDAEVYVVAEGTTWIEPIAWKEYKSDGLDFYVRVSDDNHETTEQSVRYHYEDGTFKLQHYNHRITWNCYIRDGYLEFWNLSSGDDGRVYGTVERDIRYLSYEKLPKTPTEARNELSIAPDDLPTGRILGNGGGTLQAKNVNFTGGRNYPVYLGPGETYMRSGNGKGAVSTNDWIQVFGKYEDWIMIQYDISADRYRIGWIEAKALPSGANVPEINFFMLKEKDYNDVVEQCILTDDPFNSRSVIAVLEAGTPLCEIVYSMGGWSYVRVTINGVDVCGFVPSDCISHG